MAESNLKLLEAITDICFCCTVLNKWQHSFFGCNADRSSSDISLTLFGYDQRVSATCKRLENQSARLSKAGFKTLKTLPAPALGRAALSPLLSSQGERSDTARLALREPQPAPSEKQLNDRCHGGWDYFPLYSTRHLLKCYVIKKITQVDKRDSFFLFALKMNKHRKAERRQEHFV